jgi:predicted metalloprotease with PDZ domain
MNMNPIISQDYPAIEYTIWPADLHGHRFQVKLRIENPDPAGQALQMPSWIPGSYLIRDFSKHIETIAAHSLKQPDQKLELERINNDQWRLPRIDGPVEVLATIYAFDSSVRAAYLDTERAFLNATSLCLSVCGQENIPCALVLVPPKAADAQFWSVQTTLRSAKIDSEGFGFYLAENYADLIDHPVAMGQFQLVEWKSQGVAHSMAIQGCIHPIQVKRLAEDLEAICSSTIALFEPKSKRAPFNRYLFLVNAVVSGYGGLEHRNSTALLCRRDQVPQAEVAFDEKAYQEFLGLCSHEYFHAWLVKRIKAKAFQPYRLDRRNHTRLLWLFEGFTSYYDDLQLFRSKRIDLKTYLGIIADNWNAILRSPGRNKQSLADSSFDAWTKYYQADENTPNSVVSYYGKGALLALGLDLQIRNFTKGRKSLDDLMRLIWQEHGLTMNGIEENGLDTLISRLLGSGFQKIWSQFKTEYIFGTADLPLEKWFNPRLIKVSSKSLAKLEMVKLAFGIRYTDDKGWLRLTYVLDGGVAQAAGLAPGDLISSVNGQRVTSSRWDKVITSLTMDQDCIVCFYRQDLEHERMVNLNVHQTPKQYQLSVV